MDQLAHSNPSPLSFQALYLLREYVMQAVVLPLTPDTADHLRHLGKQFHVAVVRLFQDTSVIKLNWHHMLDHVPSNIE